jgi:MFS family permease
VRELQATDAQISMISTAQRIMLLIGYYVWPRLRKRRGSRFVLLATTLVMAVYPALTAATHQVGIMILLAGVTSVFQAGVNLVFFDKLMETVPEEGGAMFVAVAQTLQYLESIVGPLISTWLTAYIGLGGALILGTCVRLAGFGLFLGDRGNRESRGRVTAVG